MLSLEILSMNVSSSPFLYFITVDIRGRATHTVYQTEMTKGSYIRNPHWKDFYQGLSCACTRWCSRWCFWRPAEPQSAGAGRGGSPALRPAAPSAAAGNASPAAQAWLRKSRGWCSLFSPLNSEREREDTVCLKGKIKICEVSKYSTHNYSHRTNVSSHVLVSCGFIDPMLCIHHHNYF